MGAADVVPGVSGGTIAFITGIYEELLETISRINFGLLVTWKKVGFKAMWTALNGRFLLALFAGIGISILSFAKLLEYLLDKHEVLLWSFFFGLIMASIWLMGKTIEKWNVINVLGLILGTAAAYVITIMSLTTGSESLFYIFICGAIAICAMILPGISGSFILLLLGAYTTILGSVSGILDAIKIKNWALVGSNGLVIFIFMLGCLAGLISFSKLLNWLFKKAKNLTISILTGFLVGSLFKIWPWKNNVGEAIIVHSDGMEEFNQINVLPANFKGDAFFWQAVIFSLLGLILVLSLEYVGSKLKKKSIQ